MVIAKRIFSLSFIFMFILSSLVFASSKEDLIVALNKTYYVGSDSYTLPEDIRVTAINYLRTHYFTEEDCLEIIKCINDAVAFANQLGTVDISKISADDLQTGINYAYKALAIAEKAPTIEEMEAKWAEEKRITEEVKKVKPAIMTDDKEVVEEITAEIINDSVENSGEVDSIDYSKYLNENQYIDDVNLEDLKVEFLKEIKSKSFKIILPYVLGIIIFLILIISLVIKKRKQKAKRRSLNEKV